MTPEVKSQLAVLRAKHGRISQVELSKQTGISQKQLSALERGQTKGIDFSTLAKLCLFFGCTPNDLLTVEVPSEQEVSLARDIVARGLARAQATPARRPEEVWADFNAACDAVARSVAPETSMSA